MTKTSNLVIVNGTRSSVSDLSSDSGSAIKLKKELGMVIIVGVIVTSVGTVIFLSPTAKGVLLESGSVELSLILFSVWVIFGLAHLCVPGLKLQRNVLFLPIALTFLGVAGSMHSKVSMVVTPSYPKQGQNVTIECMSTEIDGFVFRTFRKCEHQTNFESICFSISPSDTNKFYAERVSPKKYHCTILKFDILDQCEYQCVKGPAKSNIVTLTTESTKIEAASGGGVAEVILLLVVLLILLHSMVMISFWQLMCPSKEGENAKSLKDKVLSENMESQDSNVIVV